MRQISQLEIVGIMEILPLGWKLWVHMCNAGYQMTVTDESNDYNRVYYTIQR